MQQSFLVKFEQIKDQYDVFSIVVQKHSRLLFEDKEKKWTKHWVYPICTKHESKSKCLTIF